jgi:hypothetical protein
VGNVIRKVIVALFTKPELGGPDRDPTKARLIFVVPYLVYLIDELIYGDAIRSTYGVPPIGIGWSKAKGGMHFLQQHFTQYVKRDKLHGENYEWFAFEGDMAKLDFHITPAILTLIAMLPIFFYDPNCTDYEVLRFLMEWSSDQLTSKYLHLFDGEDRLVIGMMFSGSFLTSWGDSVYCWIIFELWYIHVFNDLRKRDMRKEAAHWKTIWPLPIMIYGDDHMGMLPSYAYEYWVGKPWSARSKGDKPVAADKFFGQAGKINMKMTDSDVFFDVLDPNGRTCPVWATLGNGYGGVGVSGPKFLQRRFIPISATADVLERCSDAMPYSILSYRPIEDYWVRASTTVNGKTMGAWLVKIRALAVDTCGANPDAYNFLKFVHDYIGVKYPEARAEIEGLEIDDPQLAEAKRKLLDKLFTVEDLQRGFPEYMELKATYWPKRGDILDCITKAQSTGFYQWM